MQIQGFAANGLKVINRANWEQQSRLTFDFYWMLGIPEDRVKIERRPDGSLSPLVGQKIIPVEKIDPADLGEAPPDATVTRDQEWFFGKLKVEDAGTLKGMSGGPIYGFRKDSNGNLSYHVVALQSRWWNKSQTIFGCSMNVFAEQVWQQLREFIEDFALEEDEPESETPMPNSNPSILLTLDLDPTRVSQRGSRHDQSTWFAPIKLSWDGRVLHAVVVADAESSDISDSVRQRWAAKLIHAAAAAALSGQLSAFKQNDVNHLLQLDTSEPTERSVTISISHSYANRLNKEYERDQLARKNFEHAVSRLEKFADHPPSDGETDDEHQMFSFLRNALAAGELETLGAWYSEKMRTIGRHIDDLPKRKNRRHANYLDAQRYMRTNLSFFKPPDAWIEEPPLLPKSFD
ncbi:MAG TPA: hypothetical protein VG713_01920 [Pirellulales bacterium]|nr:hypothetical protein [Pirellulales bacterium]